MCKRNNRILERITLAIPEQRAELGLSLSEVARLSGVSRSTVAKIERGGHVAEDLVLEVAATLILLEIYTPVPPVPATDDFGTVLSYRPFPVAGAA